MKTKSIILAMLIVFMFSSCQKQENSYDEVLSINQDIEILKNMGFDVSNILELEDNYIIDGDIIIEKLELPLYAKIPQTRQGVYKYQVKIEKQKNICIKIDNSVPFSWQDAIRYAIDEWNNIGLCNIKMFIRDNDQYDILIKQGENFENGAIAKAYYPSSSGNPGKSIEINPAYNYYTTGQKKYVLVHELGHTIGFVHSNWSISGSIPASAISEIPETPSSLTGADNQSVMYSHSGNRDWYTDGGFTTYDIRAARYVYPYKRSGGSSGPTPKDPPTVNNNMPCDIWVTATFEWDRVSIGRASADFPYDAEGFHVSGTFYADESATNLLRISIQGKTINFDVGKKDYVYKNPLIGTKKLTRDNDFFYLHYTLYPGY